MMGPLPAGPTIIIVGGAAGGKVSAVDLPKEARVATETEILEENRKVRRLQMVVDLVINVLRQSDVSVEEASELVAATREFALRLFPDKELTYDLIYRPRFQRLLTEKFKMV